MTEYSQALVILGIGIPIASYLIHNFFDIVVPNASAGQAAIVLSHFNNICSTAPRSERNLEVKALYSTVQRLPKGTYILVNGEKDSGKSCVIDSAALLGNHPVIKIDVEPTSSFGIEMEVIKRIGNCQSIFFSSSDDPKKVLYYYNKYFKSPPIVVLKQKEYNGFLWKEKNSSSEMKRAALDLSEKYGLHVIVEQSPQTRKTDFRENETAGHYCEIDIGPMERSVLEGMPELQELVRFLRAHHLADGVWEVLGGSPGQYIQLSAIFLRLRNERQFAETELMEAVQDHIAFVLWQAWQLPIDENDQKILSLFYKLSANKITVKELKSKYKLEVNYPNKLFVEEQGEGEEEPYVRPATTAVHCLVKHCMTRQEVKACKEMLFPTKNEVKPVLPIVSVSDVSRKE